MFLVNKMSCERCEWGDFMSYIDFYEERVRGCIINPKFDRRVWYLETGLLNRCW